MTWLLLLEVAWVRIPARYLVFFGHILFYGKYKHVDIVDIIKGVEYKGGQNCPKLCDVIYGWLLAIKGY